MTVAPYGTWESPITLEMVAGGDGVPGHLGLVGDEVWWIEPRPGEGGRRTLVRQNGESVLPAPWNVRNRVHEYGGTPWAGTKAAGGPLIVFTNFDDQRMYRFEPDSGEAPRPLTPVPDFPSGLRWSEMVLVPERGEAWAVLEEFTGPNPTELRRVLAAVPLDGSAAEDRVAVRELTDDRYRFLVCPRLSPDGGRLSWIAWNHPDMPWDRTELRVAEVTGEGRLENARTVAGGRESIPQAEWTPDGALVAAGDRSGWWNLRRIDPETGDAVELFPTEEEFAGPLWTLGSRWFRVLDDGRIACVHGRGESRLGILDPESGVMKGAEGPWTNWAAALLVRGGEVVGLAAGPDRGYEVVACDASTGSARVIAHEHVDLVDPGHYPRPEHRTFTGPDGREVHAHLYPPRNPGFEAPEGELPPYVVWVHGGPTSHFRTVLDLELAYFTSRGIGVVEVNYGGSSGYGREYRNRLREQWGVVDVEDCAAVARALADEGVADRSRLAIRGGSAGGWTAAVSLTSPAAEGVYACATIKYPILDLSGWTGDETHDFEARYVYSIVGPPEVLDERSRERSAVYHADRIGVPFLLMQGLEDAVCPPAQSEKLLRAIENRGVAHAYRTYEGEQHGFRRASTIRDAVLAEHSLYAQVLGFEGPEPELELRP